MAKTVTELVSAFEPQMSPEAQQLITEWTQEIIDRTAHAIVMSVWGLSPDQLEAIKQIRDKIKGDVV